MGQRHPAFIWVAYGVFVLMNIVDLVYTEGALRHGMQEGNPFMERIYLDHGIIGLGVVKGISLGIIFCLVPTFKKFKVAERVFYFCVFVYTCLTFYHLWLYVVRIQEANFPFT